MSEDKTGEFKALINLVDEPDHGMYSLIEKRIIEHGLPILPLLQEELENTFKDEVSIRLRYLISIINSKYVQEELVNWKKIGTQNLLHALYLIAKHEFDTLNFDDLRSEINNLKYDIWIEMKDSLTILEKIKVFNHVMYDIHGYKPNRNDFHNPHNSFINKVLELKTGNPILMASMYIIIAQELELPVFGVNVPEHFICVVVNNDHENFPFLQQGDPLFYINPFSNGSLFTKVQLSAFLKQIKTEEKPEFFAPCTNDEIVVRVLNNIIHSYTSLNDNHKAALYKDLKNMYVAI